MSWDPNDQITQESWKAAQAFFTADKKIEVFHCLSEADKRPHIFVRTDDGHIYGINKQDSQTISQHIKDKKQWPKEIVAINAENQTVTLELVDTLFNAKYQIMVQKTVTEKAPTIGWKEKLSGIKDIAEQTMTKASSQISKATDELSKKTGSLAETASKSGWKEKLGGIKDIAEQTMTKASSQISKATDELGKKTHDLSEAAGKAGWKDRMEGLKHKAEHAVEKAGSQISKAGAELGKVSELKPKENPESKAQDALKRLPTHLEQIKRDAEAIRVLSDPKRVAQYKQLSAVLDDAIQKLSIVLNQHK